MVIVDNVITYPFPSPLLFWRPGNEALFVFCTAIVTTLLTYQLTAIAHDLLFGLKPSGWTRISDLTLFLLTNSSSPSFVFRTISANQHADVTKRYRIIVKLVILFIIAPIMSITSILLSQEVTENVSFSQAGFGGMAVGYDGARSSPPSEQSSKRMHRRKVDMAWHDTPAVDFIMLEDEPLHAVDPAQSTGNSSVVVEISASDPEHITTDIIIRSREMILLTKTAGVILVRNSKHTAYFLMETLSQEAAKALATYGAGLVAEWCNVKGNGVETVPKASGRIVARRVDCTAEGNAEDLEAIANNISGHLNFVNSPVLQVKEWIRKGTGENPIFDGRDLLFLTRRKSIMSMLSMTILLGISFIFRAIVGVATRNDLPTGLGLILRNNLGLPWCDSMLAGRVVVKFENGIQ